MGDSRNHRVSGHSVMAVFGYEYLNCFMTLYIWNFQMCKNNINHCVVMHEGYELARSWSESNEE